MTDLSRQNVFKSVQAAVVRAVARLAEAGKIPAGLDAHKATAEPPRDPSHGDVSTNAAMLLSKPAGMKPRDLAQLLVDELLKDETLPVVEAAPAGPGFVNLRLAPSVWHDVLRLALASGDGFGQSDLGAGRKVNVEYVSANPTGPMHVGHARGAVVGDALARLLAKAGFAVEKEYYINDAGAQVDVLARSAHLRYREALGDAIGEIPQGLYPGDYLKPVGQALADKFGDRFRDAPESDWLVEIRDFAIDAMMALIKEDLKALGVEHNLFSSERALVAAGGVEKALKVLEDKGLVYVGVLEPPKGKPVDDWEPRPQTLFKSSSYGDDVDRPLKKSDGSWTYFAADIAYHWDKAQRSAPTLIDVWGVDHGGYVKRVAAAVNALTDGAAKLDVKLCALVNLTEDGQPVKMSKRAGTFVTLRDVVDAVGSDVVRFTMLTRKNDATLDFDLKKVLEQSKDNPVFYVQYAHARIASVLRNAADLAPNLNLNPDALEKADFTLLTDEAEIGLIKHVASWPRLVEAAAEAHEPHRIAFYLGELAALFHALWNKGREDASLRFISPDAPGTTQARLALVRAVMGVIASGLAVMGVTPVQEMR